jgi:putative component of membrane protein insertase Oxa1/YidC/SpoIIIJ protein YidD
MVFLVSVKNSGLLFSLLLLVYTAVAVPKTIENMKKLAVLGLMPVATLFLWNRHVEQLFDGGTVSKHAMRLDNFRKVLEGKNAEDLAAIAKVFWRTTFASCNLLIYLLLRRFAVGTVLAYKAFAPLSMRGECRFQPSCSTYMIMAINRYGLVIGITKGIRRILRCKPPNGGVDYP